MASLLYRLTAVLLVFLRQSPGDCDTLIIATVVEECVRRANIITSLGEGTLYR